MASNQIPGSSEEFTAWFAEEDAKSREKRAGRLQELLEFMPIPSEAFQFFNGAAIWMVRIWRLFCDQSCTLRGNLQRCSTLKVGILQRTLD